MTTVTSRPFVSPTDLPTVLTLLRQSATAETLFDIPRYSDLASWLAPAQMVARTSREDEGYRHQMIQKATTLWETEAGEAVAYAVIPFTTSLSFAILPQWRSTAANAGDPGLGIGAPSRAVPRPLPHDAVS